MTSFRRGSGDGPAEHNPGADEETSTPSGSRPGIEAAGRAYPRTGARVGYQWQAWRLGLDPPPSAHVDRRNSGCCPDRRPSPCGARRARQLARNRRRDSAQADREAAARSRCDAIRTFTPQSVAPTPLVPIRSSSMSNPCLDSAPGAYSRDAGISLRRTSTSRLLRQSGSRACAGVVLVPPTSACHRELGLACPRAGRPHHDAMMRAWPRFERR